jgi:signal transduction histidine kinase
LYKQSIYSPNTYILKLKPVYTFLFFVIVLLATPAASAQTKAQLQLEHTVYTLNNAGQYDQSVKLIFDFLNTDTLTNQDGYYGNLYLSYTYKRLFDYAAVLKHLNQALAYGLKTNTPNYYTNNINCQKALALFDIQNYAQADSLMRLLATNNYAYVSQEYQAKLIMQEAYILFLNKNYAKAELKYDIAIAKLKRTSPCDLPMIYAKKIELYGAINSTNKLIHNYTLAIHSADSCHISKYTMYTTEIMKQTYGKLQNYKAAYAYSKIYDSLFVAYNSKENANKLSELAIQYETKKKEQELILQSKTITANNRLIALLLVVLLAILLMVALYITTQRQNKATFENKATQRYTTQLLEKTETERKRIASDLHDSINHELANLKTLIASDNSNAKNKVDSVIEDIRIISRNLHPVLFSEIGLQASIEQLVTRVQHQNKFMLTADISYTQTLTINKELQLYRILQETISNMLKYANAIAGKITMVESNNKLVVEIKDNGVGFNVTEALQNETSFGLHNIIERSHAIGGKAKITANTNGTIITIEIPITQP